MTIMGIMDNMDIMDDMDIMDNVDITDNMDTTDDIDIVDNNGIFNNGVDDMGNMDIMGNMNIMDIMIIIINMGQDKMNECLSLDSITLMRFAATRKWRVAATASRTGWKITSEFFLRTSQVV